MTWIRTLFGRTNTEDYRFKDTPEARVKSYLAHWHTQWALAKRKMGKEVDFDVWGKLVAEVDDLHFTHGRTSGTANAFSSAANHDPSLETITRCSIDGRTAQVETHRADDKTGTTRYHVYELVRNEQNNWLIEGIIVLFHPPGDPLIEPGRQGEILDLATPEAPLVKTGEHLKLDEHLLFQGDRTVTLPDSDADTVKRTTLGHFSTRSGVLGILDFGYDIYDFEPLELRVPPGRYKVETVSIYDRIAGIRLRLDENRTATQWFAAKTPGGNGVYGVDAGNLALFDVQSLMHLSYLEKEKLFSQWVLSGAPALLSMTGENDCLITPSGFGDGAYPAFWGVDDDNRVVSLYIDFMVLVKEGENGDYISI